MKVQQVPRVTGQCFVYCLLVVSLFSFPFIASNHAVAASVQIPYGTQIPLRVVEDITPETAIVGQKIILKVDRDIEVNGEVVVRAGQDAIGEVTSSTKKGAVGKAAEIGIMIRHVAAVDGTLVPLTGTKLVKGESKQTQSLIITLLCCILALVMQGEDAQIIAGTSVDAMVSTPTTIDIPQQEAQ